MRWMAFMAITAGCATAGGAAAQTLGHPLMDAAFAAHSREVRLTPRDTLQVNIAPPTNPFEGGGIDVSLVRRWPGAVKFAEGGLDFDVSPHATFGVSPFGSEAGGGATLTVSKSREQRAIQQLEGMGVEDGQARFGDMGRWYLFAAASGRAVGLNMLHTGNGWDRAGWTTDPTGALVGDAQVGVGWRKGDMQSSFGVIHREVRGNHMVFGQDTRDDTVAAFTFSLRPQR